MTAPETAERLQRQYHLTANEYDSLITAFNQEYPDARKLATKSELWGLLHYFFSQHVPY